MAGFDRKLAEQIDAHMMSALGVQTSSIAQHQEPLTLDALRKMMLAIPKPDVFLSTRRFPGGNAFTVEGGSAKYTVAGPDFWMRLQYECQRNTVPAANPMGNLYPMFGIRIIEIDGHETDDDARTAYIKQLWGELLEAIRVACVDLPEWLRPPPKFGKHG